MSSDRSSRPTTHQPKTKPTREMNLDDLFEAVCFKSTVKATEESFFMDDDQFSLRLSHGPTYSTHTGFSTLGQRGKWPVPSQQETKRGRPPCNHNASSHLSVAFCPYAEPRKILPKKTHSRHLVILVLDVSAMLSCPQLDIVQSGELKKASRKAEDRAAARCVSSCIADGRHRHTLQKIENQ